MRKFLKGIWKFLCDLVKFVWSLIQELVKLAKAIVMDGVEIGKDICKKLYQAGKYGSVGLYKLLKKYAIPVAIGGSICYFFPPIGALIASLAVLSWIEKRVHLTPVLQVGVTIAVYIGMTHLFVLAPFIVFFLAIRAVGADCHLWAARIRDWAQRAYDRGVEAAEQRKLLEGAQCSA